MLVGDRDILRNVPSVDAGEDGGGGGAAAGLRRVLEEGSILKPTGHYWSGSSILPTDQQNILDMGELQPLIPRLQPS